MRKRKRRKGRIEGGRERVCVCVCLRVSGGVCGGGARDDQRVGETFVDPRERLRSCTLARLTDVEGRRVREMGEWWKGGWTWHKLQYRKE